MNTQKRYLAFLITLSAVFFTEAVFAAEPGPIPPELAALEAKAKLQDPIVSWCKGAFVPGKPSGFAVAVSRNKTEGRYLIIDSLGQVSEIAAFTGGADLNCYTAAEAKDLAKTIAENETTHGGIVPRYKSAVICVAQDRSPTTLCWQYSPKAKAFVKIGSWTT